MIMRFLIKINNTCLHSRRNMHAVPGEDAVVQDPLCGERRLSSYEKVLEIRVFRGLS
jgi:hypothetical protein